ncbi:DUF2079 domain-containing protein [Streptomyces sp. NPDC093982]|uniref:DUF2079 domain-containing protein n=1 Tax=Streptomyces sp. NPDC093982 TaxID=3155077 RepID=UPI003427EB9D
MNLVFVVTRSIPPHTHERSMYLRAIRMLGRGNQTHFANHRGLEPHHKDFESLKPAQVPVTSSLSPRHAVAATLPATTDRQVSASRLQCWGWAGALFLLYAAFSLTQHHRLSTGGFDLGIFTQAVRSYAALGAPRSDIKGWDFNLYGDHFHPILVLLVPAYWVFPRPQTLLVAQAALLSWAVVPLICLAAKRLGKPAAHAVAVAYGLSFGVQGALAFDFHEVAFAAPLLAYGLTALVEGRWAQAAAWSAPLLLVKEEISLTAAAVGMILVLRGQRRMGLTLIAGSLLCFGLVVAYLIPTVNPQGIYPYLNNATDGGSLSSTLTFTERLTSMPLLLFTPTEKVTTLLLLSGLTCLLALFSPLSLIGLPTILIRFLSDSPTYWGTGFQYNLILMPILFAAALDAHPRVIASRYPIVRKLGRNAGAALLCAAAPLAPWQPLQNFLLHPVDSFSLSPHATTAHQLLKRIPDGSHVEATNHLSAQLAHRTRVFLWDTQGNADWVIYDLTDPSSPRAQLKDRVANHLANGYELSANSQDIVLLHRR